jgi:hypothetical protein
MDTISGELVRHQNHPFYSSTSPKYFWFGCLGPALFILVIIMLAAVGARSSAGLTILRGYLLFILGFLIVQFLLGAGIYWKQRSSLAKGLVLGSITLFVLIVLVLIGVFTLFQSFLH